MAKNLVALSPIHRHVCVCKMHQEDWNFSKQFFWRLSRIRLPHSLEEELRQNADGHTADRKNANFEIIITKYY
jgi:hypothetical protein